MNPRQKDEFERVGLTCLRGAVEPTVARDMCDRVWERADSKLGIRRDDASTWRRVPPSVMKECKETGWPFDPILAPVVTEVLDGLLGPDWVRPQHPGQLLTSAPVARDWVLPHQIWHMDSPAPGWIDGLSGAQVFLLLDRVEPRGGGTLVAGGSHRLVAGLPERQDRRYPGRSAQIRKALRIHVQWMRELWQEGPNEARVARFFEETTAYEGIPLQVLEITGEPGDVFLMHPWMLHAPSMNCSGRMRVMLTERLSTRGARLFLPRGD